MSTQPRPGFEHIHRYVTAHGETLAKILPGELYVTGPPELITTLLGSCVSACIRDPLVGVGGMNHFMLPDCEEYQVQNRCSRYGAFAMELLINEILKAGGRRERLEVKIFGGGNMGSARQRIGAKNAEFVERYLATEGLRVASRCLGGNAARRLIYDPGSGRVRQLKLPPLDAGLVMDQEGAYERDLNRDLVQGSLELFDRSL